MPGFTWLANSTLDGAGTQAKMRVLRMLGVPYTDQEIANAPADIGQHTEMDALIAYLQGLKYLAAENSQ
jgi:cytochrome c oxidase cbb3-type subunit 2